MKRRSILAQISAALLAVAIPTAASAEIRSGTGSDLVGDSSGTASADFVSVYGQYDTNGQALVTATVNGDIASGPVSNFTFNIQSFLAPSSCTGSYVSMFGSSTGSENLVIVSGVKGLGSSASTVSGNTITFRASGTALQNKDWSCVTATVGQGAGTVDQLNVPVFFTGYGPDTDADGLKDNQDQCPTVSGPAPTGCPPAPAPAPISKGGSSGGNGAKADKCSAPRLKGKTLGQAKAAITAAHCTLGKVSKPKSLPKGSKLVVTKQATSNGKINLTLGIKSSGKASHAR